MFIKYNGCSSEHKLFSVDDPRTILTSEEEMRYLNNGIRLEDQGICVAEYSWFNSDDLEKPELIPSEHSDLGLPIATVQKIPSSNKNMKHVQIHPIWQWIKVTRTEEQQAWIEDHIEELEQIYLLSNPDVK